MRQILFKNLACPIDLEPLKIRESTPESSKSCICPLNHTFDIARQGYVNLLPAQFKHSKNPGDQKQMVVARTAFLNSGAYAGVLEALYDTIKAFICNMPQIRMPINKTQKTAFNIVDAGCGEGYYTAGLAQKLMQDASDGSFGLLGYDISKEAVAAAAKRSKDITWAVATNARIPVVTKGADIVLCLFGFPVFEEFARILKPGGLVILIDAGPNHLIELRQKIYETVFEKNFKNLEIFAGFHLQSAQRHQINLKDLTGAQAANLLKMTPHYYRMQKDKYESVITNVPDNVTLDFRLACYRTSIEN